MRGQDPHPVEGVERRVAEGRQGHSHGGADGGGGGPEQRQGDEREPDARAGEVARQMDPDLGANGGAGVHDQGNGYGGVAL